MSDVCVLWCPELAVSVWMGGLGVVNVDGDR